jgi:hypothetical protein
MVLHLMACIYQDCRDEKVQTGFSWIRVEVFPLVRCKYLAVFSHDRFKSLGKRVEIRFR